MKHVKITSRAEPEEDPLETELDWFRTKFHEVCAENLELLVAYGEAQRENLLLKGRLDRAERDLEALTFAYLACRTKATNEANG